MNKNKKLGLSKDTKKALRSDFKLAIKICDALGGNISVDSYIQYINRNSPKLTKDKILEIIADHLNTSTDKLLSGDKPTKGNNKNKIKNN